MSLLASLPAPTKQVAPLQPTAPPSTALVTTSYKEPPPYLRRQGFVPRKAEDFGDGGAFPEIHVAQYPLEMGRPDQAKGAKTLAVTVDEDGKINYDAIVKQGSNRGKIIHSDHKALVPKVDKMSAEALQRPDEDEIKRVARETQEALEKVVATKLATTASSKALPEQPKGPTYIKYTPSQQGAAWASGAGQRIIKMQDMPVDPLEPPKFRHTKVPRGPGSPPVPVMHSPPRALTVKDQQDWKIPPCISNWKNPKGYTIPLDKRLAADGRGLQQQQINDKFASLSEALFTAEAKAREAITMRAAIQKELLAKEKAKKEQELRELAMKARLERLGGMAGRMDAGAGAATQHDDEDDAGPGAGAYQRGPEYEETAEEREERRKRDDIREERRRERERERRLESKEGHGVSKKSKLTRDRNRDISEKVALGMANVGGTGEVMYDQRLFNQEQGMASGFGAEDGYGVYDKPLFADRSAAGALYRPKQGAEDVYGDGDGAADALRTDKFKPDKGFKGAEVSAGPRSAPVEFERQEEEADPFGLDQFLDQVKKGGKKGALDGVGRSGGMNAAGGGGSYDDLGGSGKRMQFTSGSGR